MRRKEPLDEKSLLRESKLRKQAEKVGVIGEARLKSGACPLKNWTRAHLCMKIEDTLHVRKEFGTTSTVTYPNKEDEDSLPLPPPPRGRVRQPI